MWKWEMFLKTKDFHFKDVLMNFCYFMCIYIATMIIFLICLNPIINFYETGLTFPLIGKLSYPAFILILVIFAAMSGTLFLFVKVKYNLKLDKFLLLGVTLLAVLIPLDAHITIYYFAPEYHQSAYWIVNDLLLLLIVIGILLFLIIYEFKKNRDVD